MRINTSLEVSEKTKKDQGLVTIIMNNNILMIYPESPTTYWSMKHALPFAGKKAQLPPLGLITIAAMLPAHYNVKLVDINVSQLTDSDINNAGLILISAMIVQKESFDDVVKRCKKAGKTIVAGGPYPTTSYKSIEGVDHFVLNEGEITLPRFLRDFENGSAERIYTDESKPDITGTPVPRFDLLDIDKYYSMVLQFSRGCPFNCEFCDIIEMFGRTPRTKTPEQFIRELDTVYQTGFNGALFIVDDNFIGNKAAAKTLLPHIAEWQSAHGYPYRLFTEASVDLAEDDKLLEMMVRSGFDMVFIGIETPVEQTLIYMQKPQNTRIKLIDSVRRIQNAGLEVTAGFILGFDNDPEDIFDLQINFIKESGIPMAMVSLLMALPKTQLYRRLIREDRLLAESSGNNTHNFYLNYIPAMDKETLVKGYKRVICAIYNPEAFFNRCLKMLRHTPLRLMARREIGFPELRALFLSIIKQSFSRYGYYYLKYLLFALIKSPRFFPESVRMAIIGRHFILMTRSMLKDDRIREKEKKRVMLKEKELAGIMSATNKASASSPAMTPMSIRSSSLRLITVHSHDIQ